MASTRYYCVVPISPTVGRGCCDLWLSVFLTPLVQRGNFTLGSVSSLSGMKDDSRFIQISTPVQPDNSGGPLLDASGNVVGVVVGQLSAVAMMQVLGSVPQNVNFAIQAPIVVNFLSTKDVTPELDSGDTHRELPWSDVADLAKKFTVLVHCEAGPPQSSQAPPAPPPSSKNATRSLERQAKEFVLVLEAKWSRPNEDALAGLEAIYDDEVMYFGKKSTRGNQREAGVRAEISRTRVQAKRADLGWMQWANLHRQWVSRFSLRRSGCKDSVRGCG